MTDTGNTSPGEGPKAGSEAGSGKSELASLIEQYEAGKQTDGGNAADIARVVKAVEPAVSFVEEMKAERAVNSQKAKVDGAIDDVLASEHLAAFKDRSTAKQNVRDFLHGFAERTPGFNDAFNSADPEAFKAMISQATESFVKDRLPEFATDRADIEAAAAAVAGQMSSSPGPSEGPSPAQMMSMSDQDWKAHKAKKLAEAASG